MLMKHLSKDDTLGRGLLTPRCPGQSRLQQLILNPGHLGLGEILPAEAIH